MAEAAQRAPEIARDRADIGAFAAFGFERRLIAIERDEIKAMDDDLA